VLRDACRDQQTGQFSGILGLGFPTMSAYDITPVFDNVLKQNLLSMAMFSFYLSRFACVLCAEGSMALAAADMYLSAHV